MKTNAFVEYKYHMDLHNYDNEKTYMKVVIDFVEDLWKTKYLPI